MLALSSLAVFYFLLRRLADAKVALWAVFLLAICPWHVMMSRWGLESNLLPSMFLLGVWLLLKGTERPGFFVTASLSSPSACVRVWDRLFAVPLFLCFGVRLCALEALDQRVALVLGIGVAVFAIVATPIAAVIWANQKHIASFGLAGIGIPRM